MPTVPSPVATSIEAGWAQSSSFDPSRVEQGVSSHTSAARWEGKVQMHPDTKLDDPVYKKWGSYSQTTRTAGYDLEFLPTTSPSASEAGVDPRRGQTLVWAPASVNRTNDPETEGQTGGGSQSTSMADIARPTADSATYAPVAVLPGGIPSGDAPPFASDPQFPTSTHVSPCATVARSTSRGRSGAFGPVKSRDRRSFSQTMF